MNVVWWFIAIVAMAIGLLGTVIPFLPGTTIILATAIFHRLLVGPENGMSWWAIGILVLLTLVSYALDFAGSFLGPKYFGASRWGMLGAAIGVIVGIFTGFVTLLVAPLIGAVMGELIAGKKLVDAGKAGWGTLVGKVAGMVAQLSIALAMIVLFLMNAASPGH